MFKAGLAYLENQKEQRQEPFSCGHENGKSTEWAELQSEFKNINEAFENGKKEVIDHPDKYGLTKQKPVDFPTTDEEVKEFLETHPKVEVPEKYKTPDPVFSKQEYESYPIISEDTTSAKPVELDGKALLYTADKSYQIGFRDGVASVKPAECSKATINGQPIPTENHSVDIPLAEWSDEDEKDIAHIIRILDDCYAYEKHDLSKTDHENLVNKLKSLRPQSQGIYQQVVKGIRDMCDRYEQNGMFTDERARDFLGNVRVKCKDAIECAPILDEPSWKPSEEQMAMLLAVINDPNNAGAESCYMVLKSIYNNLKELM